MNKNEKCRGRILRAMSLLLALSLVAIGLSLGVAGCAAKEKMLREADVIKDKAGQVRAKQKEVLELGGPVCGLKELAIAESQRAFALYEMEQGHYPRFQSHLVTADEAIQLSWAKAKACEPPDRDRDRILDSDDRCPDDPEDKDEFEDADGCPDPDNDKDGILDEEDKCPNDFEDIDEFQDEDGCPDLDNDEDGIPDSSDACPNDAEDMDEFEDTDGCPDPDNDQDGILDADDKCPNEAETFNGIDDEDGCPDETYTNIEVTEKEIKIKQRIFFANGRATILSQSFPVLNEIIQALKSHPTLQVEIGGHTDSNGDDAYNKRLSQQRADSVRKYLIENGGIAADRLTAVGYGEEQPIESNRTADGRAKNRRVEFRIIKK
jgi:outer membrane protein OmpA-like peptidoglycan-associated protein